MEDFSWIDDILPEEDKDGEEQGEERHGNETNPSSLTYIRDNVIVLDNIVKEAREEDTKENLPDL